MRNFIARICRARSQSRRRANWIRENSTTSRLLKKQKKIFGPAAKHRKMIRLDRVSLPTVISGRHRRRSRQPQRHKDTKTLVILSGLGVFVVHALMTKPTTYREAGVNIDAANRATEKIKELARATFNART